MAEVENKQRRQITDKETAGFLLKQSLDSNGDVLCMKKACEG
jgi:hypothetical protein